MPDCECSCANPFSESYNHYQKYLTIFDKFHEIQHILSISRADISEAKIENQIISIKLVRLAARLMIASTCGYENFRNMRENAIIVV